MTNTAEKLDMSTLKSLITDALTALKSNKCYLKEVCEILSNYQICVNDNLHNEVKTYIWSTTRDW